MQRKITSNKTNSYTHIQDYFLSRWVSIIGIGPAMLYLQLLSYCHKGKDAAWPSIQNLDRRMGTTTKTLIKYRHALVKYSLIKKVVKQKSSTGGYFHNLYKLVILDNERVLLPPAERCPEETEEVISGIAEESTFIKENSLKRININDRNSLKKKRMMEKLKKIKLDKKTIDKIIINYSPEDIERKLDLLEMKRNVVNPAGWLVAALQANYPHPEFHQREDNEKTTSTEEIEPENKIEKPKRILPSGKGEEEKKILSREESLKWIRHIRNNVIKNCQMP